VAATPRVIDGLIVVNLKAADHALVPLVFFEFALQ
jgi:hypothetical protein